MIWPVPDAPAMACHESGGPPARSAATLGGENHHLRVDGLHLRCPTNSSRAPPGAIPVDCQVSHRPPLRTSGSPPGGDLDESARPAGEEAAVSAAQCIGQLEQGRLIQGHRSVLFCEFLGGFSQGTRSGPPTSVTDTITRPNGPNYTTPWDSPLRGSFGSRREPLGARTGRARRRRDAACLVARFAFFVARASPRSPSTCLST
jgi:hypothetical protein